MAYTTIDNPGLFFNTKLYTGNGSTQSITGVGFQPDWTWLKQRSGTSNHRCYDSVRGATKQLLPNSSNAENTETNGLTSFDSDGFSLGNEGGHNENSQTFASWNWKAGTSVSGTTTGSGTGKAYSGSVNTTAGFSIITYLGNGTEDHTIPHHLGVAPKMYWVKQRNDADSWIIYHDGLGGADKYILLDTSGAAGTSNNPWGSVAPTSTVNNLGSAGDTNGNGDSFIMYSFAEIKGYSKFGKYTGNGQALRGGPLIYLGFKPAFVLLKESSSVENWLLMDNKRLGYNKRNELIFPNLNNAEQAHDRIDLVSNGFKVNDNDGSINQNNETYIYMAFAENPFVANDSGTAVPVTAR